MTTRGAVARGHTLLESICVVTLVAVLVASLTAAGLTVHNWFRFNSHPNNWRAMSAEEVEGYYAAEIERQDALPERLRAHQRNGTLDDFKDKLQGR